MPELDVPIVVFTHALLPNGPAHRLVAALRTRGITVQFCALPFLGGDHYMEEWSLVSADSRTHVKIDADRHVPMAGATRNVLRSMRFAQLVRRMGYRRAVVIGCDALSSLLGLWTLRFAGVEVSVLATYFVDYSPQRLGRRGEGWMYRHLCRWAVKSSDVICAISHAARDAIVGLASGNAAARGVLMVLPNVALTYGGTFLPRQARPRRVVSLGGLRSEHGAKLLPEIISKVRAQSSEPVGFDIVGDGPELGCLREACVDARDVCFRGRLTEIHDIREVIANARVGLALYDPSFPMFAYNDSLKIKDYLAGGLAVVTTLKRTWSTEPVETVAYEVDEIAAAIVRALDVSDAEPSRVDLVPGVASEPIGVLVQAIAECHRRKVSARGKYLKDNNAAKS